MYMPPGSSPYPPGLHPFEHHHHHRGQHPEEAGFPAQFDYHGYNGPAPPYDTPYSNSELEDRLSGGSSSGHGSDSLLALASGGVEKKKGAGSHLNHVGVGGPGSNKKERRRTQSINTAFANLRDCIPNVPCDTKLSKIKTLRLATSYIDYLMTMLHTENPESFIEGFKADIHKKWNEKSEDQKRRELVRKTCFLRDWKW